ATVRLKEWFEKFNISEWWNKKVEELSKGMAQKVQFIVTVLHRPKLLIFDEPFSGFDPINAELLKNEILKLRDSGSTVIFSTHNMGSVEEICDHITLINRSHNILSGAVDEVKARYARGRYELELAGDTQGLINGLDAMATDIMVEPAKNGRTKIGLRLHDGMAVSRLVTMANEMADLRGFREVMPTMNEIFIQAVKENSGE
ncbi:MAG: DUF4162 domain-containing protein, partial [Muribaculaceae bacterium]|nr:DUF4162 domain-containing protein [Muribaculaceae bacterium]